jgi:hypothetical protein
MKITRETLKQMIAEEVAKLDPQNEGFMDATKGMGKYLGSKVGMKTDEPALEFAEKIGATLKQVGFDPAADELERYFIKSGDNKGQLMKVARQAARELYKNSDEAKRAQLVQVAQKVEAELDKWESSPSAKQASSFGSGKYSPNDKAEGVLMSANFFVSAVDLLNDEMQQYGSIDESKSYLSTSLNNLKKVVAEEIIKMELENKGK